MWCWCCLLWWWVQDVGLSLLHEREAAEVRACLKAVIHTLNM